MTALYFQATIFLSILIISFFSIRYTLALAIVWTLETFLLLTILSPLFTFQLIVIWGSYIIAKYIHNQRQTISNLKADDASSNIIKEANCLSQFNGFGKFICRQCDYREDIYPFIHGFRDGQDYSMAYQCQECGKIQSVDSPKEHKTYYCKECTGELSNTKTLFCPDCKSRDVHYDLIGIT